MILAISLRRQTRWVVSTEAVSAETRVPPTQRFGLAKSICPGPEDIQHPRLERVTELSLTADGPGFHLSGSKYQKRTVDGFPPV